MTFLRRSVEILGIVVLTTALNGCGSGSPTPPADANEIAPLNDLAEVYRVYSITNNRPPRKAAEVEKMENVGPLGVQAVRQGDVVVQWGTALTDISEEPGKVASDEILAYQKGVPTEGGFVLLRDRTIKKMTPEEFQAAPKAGK